MDSLTTAYLVCMLIGSTCAVGGALAGNKTAPIDSSSSAAEYSTRVDLSEKKDIPVVEQSSITFESAYNGGTLPVYRPKSNKHDKIVYIETLPPASFFEKQMKFIQSLSEEEKLILKSYTWLGDNIINYYVRSKQSGISVTNKELLSRFSEMKDEYSPKIMRQLMGIDRIEDVSEENIESTLLTYIIKFHKTFNKAPSTDEELTVFRGTMQEVDKHTGYISTTYNPFSGSLFSAFTGDSCCLYELKIPIGTRVLLMDLVSDMTGECEILIGPGSTITKSKKTTKELWKITTNSTPDKKKSITVFEGIVQPTTNSFPLT